MDDKNSSDREEKYEIATLQKQPGQIERSGLLISPEYLDFCTSLMKGLENIYTTEPRQVRGEKMLGFIHRGFEPKYISSCSSVCQKDKLYCQLVQGCQMLTLYGGWDYQMLEQSAQNLLKILQMDQVANSNFYELGLMDVLCYFNIKLGKLNKASQLFEDVQQRVSYLETCDFTANVYRILGIWHTKMAYYHSVSNFSIQDKHFQKALQFFEKNRAHLIAFHESGGSYKTYDIPLSNIWIIRCKLKLPWLLLQPNQDRVSIHQSCYNTDKLSQFLLTSRVSSKNLLEAEKRISSSKAEIQGLLDSVPVFMQNQIQAIEVALYFRKAQGQRSKLDLMHALYLSKLYKLEQFEYGSGWISAIPHVLKSLSAVLLKCQPFQAHVKCSSSANSESCDSDTV